MKKTLLLILTLIASLSYAQINKTESLIPQLQYDQDFMTYVQINMMDGFTTVKQVVGKMKFVAGQKVYAIEKKRFADEKTLIDKITFFYLQDTPIAISIEKAGKVKIFYLSQGKVIAYKELSAKLYKPWGGKKTLNLKNIPAVKEIPILDEKLLSQSQNTLKLIKQSSKDIFNYSF